MIGYTDVGAKNNETTKILQSLILGCAAGLFTCAALLSLATLIFVKTGNVPTECLSIVTTVISTLGAYCSGYFTIKVYKKRGLLMGGLGGLILFAVIIATGISRGIAGDIVGIIIKAALLTSAGACGGVVRVNKKTKVKKYK